jgi:hypothetical protein
MMRDDRILSGLARIERVRDLTGSQSCFFSLKTLSRRLGGTAVSEWVASGVTGGTAVRCDVETGPRVVLESRTVRYCMTLRPQPRQLSDEEANCSFLIDVISTEIRTTVRQLSNCCTIGVMKK